MEKQFGNVYMKRFLYFNVYVIKGKNGDILIDTGFIGIRRPLKKWLSQFNIKLIVLTHAHVDHVWNVAYLQSIYNCDVALSLDDIENLDNSVINPKPLKKKFRLWTKVMKKGMNLFNTPKFDIDIKLKNNQIIRRYGIKLEIISLPGHTNGTVGIKYKDYLFVGDALVHRRRKPSVAYQNQNVKAAIKSAQIIDEIKPDIIFVGHDKPIYIDNYDIDEVVRVNA